ncbi:MAG: hypothetical protein QF652_07540 [Dehalococcoidia bacterium]|jgi:hypothetical protein|nr:hypothetical protein [Dehalococcoidia bacterium]
MQRFLGISAIALFAMALVFAPGALAQNEANVTQAGTDGDVIIAQDGDSNVATVNQLAESFGSTVDIAQSGDSSIVSVAQAGGTGPDGDPSFLNSVTVSQTGTGDDDNTLLIAQGVTGMGGKDDPVGDMASWGNLVDAVQGGDSPGSGLTGALQQTGPSNTIQFVQDGTDSDAFIMQTGDVDVDGIVSGGGNSATTQQTGNANSLSVTQGFDEAGLQGGNAASITQIGDENLAVLEQSGDQCTATFLQEGAAVATAIQSGINNSVSITQSVPETSDSQ